MLSLTMAKLADIFTFSEMFGTDFLRHIIAGLVWGVVVFTVHYGNPIMHQCLGAY